MIAVCAIFVSLPLAIRGNSCGHDFDFHLQSWLAVVQHWHQATIYPHWVEAANYGAGEPRFVFYPPLTWMLGALLSIVMPWAAVPGVFTFSVMAGCGLSMYQLARRWLPPNAAALAGCAYVLNPYALFVAYERTAYGELAAGIWLPLIVLYGTRSGTAYLGSETLGSETLGSETWGAETERSRTRNVVALALAIAAVWLTNAPAAVMSCYTLAAIILWKSIRLRRWQPILDSAIALLLGLGLASFYLVPAAYERRWVDIARAIGPGMRVQDSFLFARTGESFHDQVLRTASWIFVSMLVTIAAAGLFAGKRQSPRRFLWPLYATAALLLALQLPWSQFIWTHAPELKFLQFPWRWSLVLSIPFALSLGAAALPPNRNQLKSRFVLQKILTLVAAIALVSTSTWLFWQRCDEEDVVSAQLTLWPGGSGFEGTDEYTPLGVDNSIIQQSLPPIRILNAADAETGVPPASDEQANPSYTIDPSSHVAGEFRIERWQTEDIAFSVRSAEPGFAVVRLMDYPAWVVRANDTVVIARPHRDDGLLTIPVQRGLTRIKITYSATPDVWLGRGLSAVSLAALLLLAGLRRKAEGRIS
ncbi:hypothetical protein ACPOL_0363 [Acidisarcina polymorpha]|uniref:Membrane protein 6-pyruvoyl-tetrahydropterin synthase-related domain-containing protein n=1 Tax=Acidisarcina polymorpha TaxID=2211140 RepID=A0A2Z5FTC2_9BACT|nr:hypothetical protein ACPOL_0363 [Acidisarcina polymorpha]